MKRFQYILHGQMARINIAIAKSQTDLGKVLRNTTLDATQDQYTGFFNIAMAPVYEHCKQNLKGAGVKARCIQHFSHELSRADQNSPYMKLALETAITIMNNVQTNGGTLCRDLTAIMADIEDNFDAMIVERETTDHSDLPARRALKDYLAQHGEFNDIMQSLQAIQARYSS